MKETNMEHYRGEIEAVKCDVAIHNGVVVKCGTIDCKECDFFGESSCAIGITKWLMSEYKPEPVLTQKEKGFIECVGKGYISRDKSGSLGWSEDKVEKSEADDCWVNGYDIGFADLKQDTFEFITWEDEEPWSVEELRKLKVENE